jgi:hypothetical protein
LAVVTVFALVRLSSCTMSLTTTLTSVHGCVGVCMGRYDGLFHENIIHGRGVFTSAKGGWTYSGALDQWRPTEGELVEADGRRFKVTYAKDCAFITQNPEPKSKVGVVCGAAGGELPAVRTRACEAAGMCGAGHCGGTLSVDMLRTAGVCVRSEALLTLLS